jgi:hypothetical protein
LTNRDKLQETYELDQAEESFRKSPSDHGNVENSINSLVSNSKVIKPKIQNQGNKIVAKLSKDIEPYVHHDRNNYLNEKRRIRKINSRLSQNSPKNPLSETIILDLEAEFNAQNLNLQKRRNSRIRDKTPASTGNHEKKLKANAISGNLNASLQSKNKLQGVMGVNSPQDIDSLEGKSIKKDFETSNRAAREPKTQHTDDAKNYKTTSCF